MAEQLQEWVADRPELKRIRAVVVTESHVATWRRLHGAKAHLDRLFGGRLTVVARGSRIGSQRADASPESSQILELNH